MLEILIYLFMKIEAFQLLFGCGIAVGFVSTLILWLYISINWSSHGDVLKSYEERMSRKKQIKWKYRLAKTIFIFSIMMEVLIPNKTTVALMYVVPKIARNEQIQQIPDNILQFINTELKVQIQKNANLLNTDTLKNKAKDLVKDTTIQNGVKDIIK